MDVHRNEIKKPKREFIKTSFNQRSFLHKNGLNTKSVGVYGTSNWMKKPKNLKKISERLFSHKTNLKIVSIGVNRKR